VASDEEKKRIFFLLTGNGRARSLLSNADEQEIALKRKRCAVNPPAPCCEFVG
jgi:hypothetical protein